MPDAAAYAEARAKRMRCAAESAQLDLRLKRGELLEEPRVTFVVSMVLRSLRDNLRGLPAQLMHQLRGMDDPKQINLTLSSAIDRVLRKTADMDLSAQLRCHSQTASNGAKPDAEPVDM